MKLSPTSFILYMIDSLFVFAELKDSHLNIKQTELIVLLIINWKNTKYQTKHENETVIDRM